MAYNKEYYEYLQEHPSCEMCSSPSIECHHLKTKGAGGKDRDYNLLAVCRRCHINVHSFGLTRMSQNFTNLKARLIDKGWQYDHNRCKWYLPYEVDNQ